MEYRIDFTGPTPDPLAIENLLRDLDPAALVDRDPLGFALRVATQLCGSEVAELLGQVVPTLSGHRLTALPSVCCGGCSG